MPIDPLPFCLICAKYDYLTPDNPTHHDLFHADKSLSHLNFAAITDRVRALEHRIAKLEVLVGTIAGHLDLVDPPTKK